VGVVRDRSVRNMTSRWGLLTNHALVLIHVIDHPHSTLRDIADNVGITERAALSLLRALEVDAIVSRRREGRRNVYTVDVDALMAHRSHGTYSVAQIANALFALSGRIPGQDLPPRMQITRADLVAQIPPAATPPRPRTK
jgi:DNA-binding MarR family transcriptional regulator